MRVEVVAIAYGLEIGRLQRHGDGYDMLSWDRD